MYKVLGHINRYIVVCDYFKSANEDEAINEAREQYGDLEYFAMYCEKEGKGFCLVSKNT